MTRRISLFLAVTLTAITMLSVVFPALLRESAEAQASFDDSEEVPVIRWLQGSSAADSVEFLGTEYFAGSSGQDFASDLVAAMGVKRSVLSFEKPVDFLNEEDIQLVAYLDDHWLNELSGWSGKIDVSAMSRTVLNEGFRSFDLDICTVIGSDITFPREADYEYDDCESWTIDALEQAGAATTMTVAEDPQPGFYNAVVLYVAIGSLVLTALMGLATVLLRRALLTTLGGGNLVLCVTGVLLAAGAVTVTSCVFLFGVGTIDDVLMVNEWNWRQHAFLVIGPGLLTALPFLVSAVLIVWAQPRPLEAPRGVNASGGVPYWMVAGAGAQQPQSPMAPQPQPQPQPQPPQTPQSPQAPQWQPQPQQQPQQPMQPQAPQQPMQPQPQPEQPPQPQAPPWQPPQQQPPDPPQESQRPPRNPWDPPA